MDNTRDHHPYMTGGYTECEVINSKHINESLPLTTCVFPVFWVVPELPFQPAPPNPNPTMVVGLRLDCRAIATHWSIKIAYSIRRVKKQSLFFNL